MWQTSVFGCILAQFLDQYLLIQWESELALWIKVEDLLSMNNFCSWSSSSCFAKSWEKEWQRSSVSRLQWHRWAACLLIVSGHSSPSFCCSRACRHAASLVASTCWSWQAWTRRPNPFKCQGAGEPSLSLSSPPLAAFGSIVKFTLYTPPPSKLLSL